MKTPEVELLGGETAAGLQRPDSLRIAKNLLAVQSIILIDGVWKWCGKNAEKSGESKGFNG
jgi:hypothetical protein